MTLRDLLDFTAGVFGASVVVVGFVAFATLSPDSFGDDLVSDPLGAAALAMDAVHGGQGGPPEPVIVQDRREEPGS